MKEEDGKKTKRTRTRHICECSIARATNYHPSKHSSMAMSRADIFINSAPSPTPTLNQQVIEYAEIYARDGIALLMHFSILCSWCDVRAHFFLVSFFYSSSLHSLQWLSLGKHTKMDTTLSIWVPLVCSWVKHFRYVSKCFCILLQTHNTYWYSAETHLLIHSIVLNMKNWLSSHCSINEKIQGCIIV